MTPSPQVGIRTAWWGRQDRLSRKALVTLLGLGRLVGLGSGVGRTDSAEGAERGKGWDLVGGVHGSETEIKTPCWRIHGPDGS